MCVCDTDVLKPLSLNWELDLKIHNLHVRRLSSSEEIMLGDEIEIIFYLLLRVIVIIRTYAAFILGDILVALFSVF